MNLVCVSPVGDTIQHRLDNTSMCICGPNLKAVLDDDGKVTGHMFIHNAMDGRE